jgi:hypothetical protein
MCGNQCLYAAVVGCAAVCRRRERLGVFGDGNLQLRLGKLEEGDGVGWSG